MSGKRFINRRELWIVVALWVWIVLVFSWRIAAFPLISPSADFSKHWDAAHELLQGSSPYDEELYLSFNYPLIVGYAYIFLAAVDLQTGEYIWETLNILFIIGGALMLAWGARPVSSIENESGRLDARVKNFARRHWLTLVFLIIVNYQPLHTVTLSSNVEPLNVLLGGCFVAFLVRRRDRLAGFFLALFALVKLGPVLVLIALAGVRRWKVFLACMATLAVYGLILLVTGLWKTELFLYTDVIPNLGHRWMGISMSLHRVLATVFWPALLDDPDGFRHFSTILNVVLLVVYLGVVFGWRRLKNRDGELFVAFGLYAILLFAPLLEENHFVWVIGAIFLQLRAWVDGRLGDGGMALCALSWGALISMRFFGELPTILKIEVHHFYFQNAVLVFTVLAAGIVAFMPKPIAREENEQAAATEEMQHSPA